MAGCEQVASSDHMDAEERDASLAVCDALIALSVVVSMLAMFQAILPPPNAKYQKLRMSEKGAGGPLVLLT